MANHGRNSALYVPGARDSTNLVSEPLDPVSEASHEGSSGQGGSGGIVSDGRRSSAEEERIISLEGTLGAMSGTVLDLTAKFEHFEGLPAKFDQLENRFGKFERLLEELTKSRRDVDHLNPNLSPAPLLHQSAPAPQFFNHSSPAQASNIPFGSVGSSTMNSYMATGEQTPPSHMRPLSMASPQVSGTTNNNSGMFYTPPRPNAIAGGMPYNPPNTNNIAQNRGQPAHRLKLPEFDGTGDVEEWLMRVDHYFSFYHTLEADRVKLCSVQLKGIAAYWLHWVLKLRNGFLTWEDFYKSIKLEFGPSQFTDHIIDLKHLKQDSGVQEYNSHFQRVSQRIQGVSESCLISHYIGGLKEEIRYELQLANPKNLLTAMQLSKLYEAKFLAIKRNYKGNSYLSKGMHTSDLVPPAQLSSTASSDQGKKHANTSGGSVTTSGRPTISPTELLRRKDLEIGRAHV